MTRTLRERQEGYESSCDFTILDDLPIIIKVTLKNYKKLTNKLELPFCADMSEIMAQTMLYTISDIQDAVMGYCHDDEIIFLLKNDGDHSWMNNDIQKISSTISSIVTVGFHKSAEIFGDELDLIGDAIFSVKTFGVPKISEAANYLWMHQAICMGKAINSATYYELELKFGKKATISFLKDKEYDEKLDMLMKHCGKDIRDDYPLCFLRGVAVYKIPVIVETKDGEVNRNKWFLDKELPNFKEHRDFTYNILNNGHDIFRKPDILKIEDK